MSLTNFVAFETNTGFIVEHGRAYPASLAVDYADRLDLSVAYLEGDPLRHYVSNGALADKTKMDTSYTVSGLFVTFLSLPPNVELTVGVESVVTDGSETIVEFDVAGTRTVKLRRAAPYFDEVVEVSVG